MINAEVFLNKRWEVSFFSMMCYLFALTWAPLKKTPKYKDKNFSGRKIISKTKKTFCKPSTGMALITGLAASEKTIHTATHLANSPASLHSEPNTRENSQGPAIRTGKKLTLPMQLESKWLSVEHV